MRYTIRQVSSLENLDPRMFAGQFLVLPNGDIYQTVTSDELGSIGSIFKKIATVGLMSAGAIAAPFTGGLSAAAAATVIGAIGAAGSVGANLINVFGSGGGGNGQQAKGLAAIQAKGQEVISAFDTLNQKINSDATFAKADAYTAADKLVAILSDSSEFYQAKNGKDGEALAKFKTQAAQLAAQSKQLADAADLNRQQALATTGGQIVQTIGANGQVVQTVQPATAATGLPFGLSTTELVIGGLAIYFLFFRNSN